MEIFKSDIMGFRDPIISPQLYLRGAWGLDGSYTLLCPSLLISDRYFPHSILSLLSSLSRRRGGESGKEGWEKKWEGERGKGKEKGYSREGGKRGKGEEGGGRLGSESSYEL
jgi:hypothetical protein